MNDKIGSVIFIGFLILFVIAIMAWPTQLLWNALMPGIFGLPELGFWQTAGLMLLSRLLFGSGK